MKQSITMDYFKGVLYGGYAKASREQASHQVVIALAAHTAPQATESSIHSYTVATESSIHSYTVATPVVLYVFFFFFNLYPNPACKQ